jgi:hypothetical protein
MLDGKDDDQGNAGNEQTHDGATARQDDQGNPGMEQTSQAAIARTSSGRVHRNKLTPRWDFKFSV